MTRAFTLIELLVVIAIIGILASLITISMDGIIDSARVQRSASAFVQSTVIAKQYALADLRTYTLTMNSARQDDPGLRPHMDYAGNNNGFDGISFLGSNKSQHGDTLLGDFTPAKFWSDRPEDQWYAIMGPFRDVSGRWCQARGGQLRLSDPVGRLPCCPANINEEDKNGGVIGPQPVYNTAGQPWFPNPTTGGFPGARLAVPNDWRTSWIWDPLGIQVGPRRFLERGTRWMARFDRPEWVTGSPASRTPCNQQANFLSVLWPQVTTGQTINWESPVTCFNFYPSGGIDRNRCRIAESYLPSGDAIDIGYVGIVGKLKRQATYTTPGGTKVTYQRPVNQMFITLKKNGDVLSGRSPILRN